MLPPVARTRQPGYPPKWMPNRRSWITPAERGPAAELEIHVLRPDGSDDRRLTTDAITDRFPAWSADGKLAWSKAGTIMVLDALDGTAHASGTGQFPSWFPWLLNSAEVACP